MRDASCKQQTKQKYKPNHQQTEMMAEEKQTNKQKLSTNLTLYEAHTNHWTNLRRAETKGRNNLTLKPGKRRPQTK